MPETSVRQLTRMECAEAAIDLFLEYRDAHGYPEDLARAHALNEVSEGLSAVHDLAVDPTLIGPGRPNGLPATLRRTDDLRVPVRGGERRR